MTGTRLQDRVSRNTATSSARRHAAVYARVSTRAQADKNGCEAQLHALRTVADARGGHVVEYIDEAQSGRSIRRPALDRLLEEAARGRVSTIYVTRLDRIARSLRHLLDLGRTLEAYGVELVVTEQNIDTTVPHGRLLFNVMGALAEWEADLTRERVRGGLEAARARGVTLGRPRVDPDVPRDLLVQIRDGTVSVRDAARRLGVAPTTLARRLREASRG